MQITDVCVIMKMVIYDSRFLAGEVGKGVFATAHEGAAQYCRKVDKREIPVCPILGVNIAVINMNWLLKYLAQNIHQLQEITSAYRMYIQPSSVTRMRTTVPCRTAV